MITDDEIALINTPQERVDIADQVGDRIMELFGAVTAGLKDSSCHPKNCILIRWDTRHNGTYTTDAVNWPERFPPATTYTGYTKVSRYGVTPTGDDNKEAMEALTNESQYSRAERDFWIADSMNVDLDTEVYVRVDNIMEYSYAGQPLELNESELVKALAKTAAHEAGHTLGLAHTAGMTSVTQSDFQEQQLINM